LLKQTKWSPVLVVGTGGKSELHRTGCWVIPSLGNEKESATENRPPIDTDGFLVLWSKGETVRQELTSLDGDIESLANPTWSKAK